MKSQLPHNESNQPALHASANIFLWFLGLIAAVAVRKMVRVCTSPDSLNLRELFSTSLSSMAPKDSKRRHFFTTWHCYSTKARISCSNALQMGTPRLSRVRVVL